MNERAKSRNRQTQVSKTDLPFRILELDRDWQLIQLADQTYGWIPAKQVQRIKPGNYWAKITYPVRNRLLRVPKPSRQKINGILRKFARTPYLWGGTTERGIDCSAFVQHAVFEWTKVLLPRNSRVQRKYGVSTKCQQLCPLDLVFFVHKKTRKSHVGVYLDDKVWHFCLDKKGLASESFEELKKRYNCSGARRLCTFK
ncbi:MAG: NlpC/P60 family protein [Patescibacteria group bacterium]